MIRSIMAVAAIGIIAAASSVQAVSNTFCERYTGALFGNATDAALQKGLVNAVVTRAFTGIAAGSGAANAVTGLYYQVNNAPYFNGTKPPMIDYLASGSSGSLTTLVDHLDRFFMAALGCRAGAAMYPWTTVSLNTKHAQMGINKVTQSAFIGQVAASLTSFGVGAYAATSDNDLNYIVALMSQFNRYTDAANSASICKSADCDMAMALVEVDVSSTGAFMTLAGAAKVSATINVNDYVHFNIGPDDRIVEADSATATTAKSSGRASIASARSFLTQFTTAGTYYFYNSNGSAATNRFSVTVGTVVASSSTGTNAASSSISTPIVAVAAVAAAAVAALFL